MPQYDVLYKLMLLILRGYVVIHFVCLCLSFVCVLRILHWIITVKRGLNLKMMMI